MRFILLRIKNKNSTIKYNNQIRLQILKAFKRFKQKTKQNKTKKVKLINKHKNT